MSSCQHDAYDVEKRGVDERPEHVELANKVDHHILEEELKYSQGGLKGIAQSPYVFGAALLASLGGFSFGYGNPPCSITQIRTLRFQSQIKA